MWSCHLRLQLVVATFFSSHAGQPLVLKADLHIKLAKNISTHVSKPCLRFCILFLRTRILLDHRNLLSMTILYNLSALWLLSVLLVPRTYFYLGLNDLIKQMENCTSDSWTLFPLISWPNKVGKKCPFALLFVTLWVKGAFYYILWYSGPQTNASLTFWRQLTFAALLGTNIQFISNCRFSTFLVAQHFQNFPIFL